MVHPIIEQNVITAIQNYGFAVIRTEHDNGAPLSYTIGLFTNPKFEYELVIIGLTGEFAHTLICNIVRSTNNGEALELDVPDSRWANLPVKFQRTSECGSNVAVQAAEYYGRDVPLVQIIMPDKNGLFPDQDGFEHDTMNEIQPML